MIAESETPTTGIQGFTAPGFEPVRELLAEHLAPFGRGGGAVAAYLDGKPVVDLWGGLAAPGRPWSEETRSGVASVTKSWAAAVIHHLAERGVLDFTTPISTWWPEFAANGKERITLTEVMLHSSGVLGFDGQVELLFSGDGSGWADYDAIAAGLAASTPSWTPGTRHGYHAVSFGWLVQEVVRRTTGSTVGQIFKTQFVEPLGLECSLGAYTADKELLARGVAMDVDSLPWLQRRIQNVAAKAARDPKTLAGRALMADGTRSILDRASELGDLPGWVAAEVPASNGVATARSQARLFAAFAAGGTLDGVKVLEPETVERMLQVVAHGTETVMTAAMPLAVRLLSRRPVPMTLGFAVNTKARGGWAFGLGPRAFGAQGYGGQWVFADPDAQLSIANICTDWSPALDKLKQKVRDAIYALAVRSA